MLCIQGGEKHTRVSEENTRERKAILPVSRDGEGKVSRERDSRSREQWGPSLAVPWGSQQEMVISPPNVASKQQGRVLHQWAIP